MKKKIIGNKRHRELVLLKRLDFFFFISYFTIGILFSISLILLSDFSAYVPYLSSFAMVATILGIFLQLWKWKILKRITEPSHLRPDPVILLAAVGVDLEEYSHLVSVNLQGLGEMIKDVGNHLSELNSKISTMGRDIGNVYTIVSTLAAEEVTLMEAVGRTSEEIGIMFEIVNAVIDEIEGRNRTMEDLVSKSREGGEKVKKTNETIQRISESSGGILKLIDFINGVSKETNLLAINASIEATHSGTEGKGFTVIADEIRKLATQTATNSREITKLLRKNINDFSLASEVTKDSGDAFAFIAKEIHVVHGTIAEVVQSIAELKTRGSLILEKAKSLDEIAIRVRDTSGEVYGEVITINGNLEETQALSDLIQKECLQMMDSKDWLVRLTNKLEEKVVEIRKETDKFIKETQ